MPVKKKENKKKLLHRIWKEENYIIATLYLINTAFFSILYYFTRTSSIAFPVYIFLMIAFFAIIEAKIRIDTNKITSIPAFLSILFFLSMMFFLSLDFIELNYSITIDESYIDANLSFWFFSSIFQGFAALLAIIGSFLVIKITSNNEETSKIIINKTKSFFPPIFYISVALILSLINLTITNIISNFPKILATAIVATALIAILGVISLCVRLYKIYK